MNGWFSYASKFIHVQILLTPNTLKNGCLHICKKESDDPKYYQKNILRIRILPLCPHFSHTNNTKFKNILITFNGKKDGDKYYLSDYDKKLSLKTRKKFIDDQ